MEDRLRHEQAFHDEQAAQRRQGWETDPTRLHFAPEEYLDHEPWVRPALARLGDIAGKHVLDFGCGHGMAATCLARMGAKVVAFDLSSGYVHEAVQRAHAHGFSIEGFVADGARLPLADESIDCIWGVAVLHHLSLSETAMELKRVLKPGGLAVFCEPWGGNPILAWARLRLPYAGKERTPDEQPLRSVDIAALRGVFAHCVVEYSQLLGMVRRAWRRCPWLAALDQADSAILRHWPMLRVWCRYVVIELRKE